MKNIKIINNTDLNYKDIGIVLDHLSERVEKFPTNVLIIVYEHKKFLVEIRNLKNYFEWRFEKYDGR